MTDKIFDKNDVKYGDALAFVVKRGFCSISTLQREFYLGYNAAATIQERMLREGILVKHYQHIYKFIKKEDIKTETGGQNE